jgi:hypothetical protein
MSWNNHDALHRHACHAYEDFRELKRLLEQGEETELWYSKLWHSLSHHLRHVVHRSGLEVDQPRIKQVRRAHVGKQHR